MHAHIGPEAPALANPHDRVPGRCCTGCRPPPRSVVSKGSGDRRVIRNLPRSRPVATRVVSYASCRGESPPGSSGPGDLLPVRDRAWKVSRVGPQASVYPLPDHRRPAGGAGPLASIAQSASATSPGLCTWTRQPFCVGTYLLAASQMAQITERCRPHARSSRIAQELGNEAPRVAVGSVAAVGRPRASRSTVTSTSVAGYQASNAIVTRTSTAPTEMSSTRRSTAWPDRSSMGPPTRPLARWSTDVRHRGDGPAVARLTVTGVYGTATEWVGIQRCSIHDRYDPGGTRRLPGADTRDVQRHRWTAVERDRATPRAPSRLRREADSDRTAEPEGTMLQATDSNVDTDPGLRASRCDGLVGGGPSLRSDGDMTVVAKSPARLPDRAVSGRRPRWMREEHHRRLRHDRRPGQEFEVFRR